MIKEIRKQLGMSQEKMAEYLDISTRQYIRIDNETSLPRPFTFTILINKLELTNEEIGIFVRNVLTNSSIKK